MTSSMVVLFISHCSRGSRQDPSAMFILVLLQGRLPVWLLSRLCVLFSAVGMSGVLVRVSRCCLCPAWSSLSCPDLWFGLCHQPCEVLGRNSFDYFFCSILWLFLPVFQVRVCCAFDSALWFLNVLFPLMVRCPAFPHADCPPPCGSIRSHDGAPHFCPSVEGVYLRLSFPVCLSVPMPSICSARCPLSPLGPSAYQSWLLELPGESRVSVSCRSRLRCLRGLCSLSFLASWNAS